MPLTILNTSDERLAGADALSVLRRCLADHGRATVLVPSYQEQLSVAKTLAEAGGLSLGIKVTTASGWAKERWEVWGDGSHVIEPLARGVVADQILSSADEKDLGSIGVNPGTSKLLADLASRALPWIEGKGAGEKDVLLASEGLTDAERKLMGLVRAYGERIHGLGLVEESEAMVAVARRLAGEGVASEPVVLLGFADMPRALREMVAGLAQSGEVTIVAREGNAGADALARRSVSLVCEALRERGQEAVAVQGSAVCDLGRAQELNGVLARLYEVGEPLVPAGAVSLLKAAGPLAEAELITQKVQGLAGAGAHDVVVAVPDVMRAWRELEPKLAARGLSVAAELSVPVLQIEAGRAFLQFVSSVAALEQLARTWPDPVPCGDSVRIRLGDMSWWPPVDLLDFLRSEISGVSVSAALRLDRVWRGDRLLTPIDVLETLQNPKQTSPQVAAATRELLRGRIGSAASKLLAPYQGKVEPRVADTFYDEAGNVAIELRECKSVLMDAMASGALAAALNIAGVLKELGLSADAKADDRVELTTLAGVLASAMGRLSLVVRPAVDAGGTCSVRIVAYGKAARLEPASVDAVLLAGQTTEETPIANGDDVLTALLAELGVEPASDPMDGARQQFHAIVRAARSHLSVERTTHDSAGKDRYPSVALTELLACYGVDESGDKHADSSHPERMGFAVSVLGEQDAEKNASFSGTGSSVTCSEAPAPAGVITRENRGLIVVPPEGRVELAGGRPLLSASQIESYLECPYKWFSLRRLHLMDSDAGFSPLEMGTFVHRVLELTHQRLLARAAARQGMDESLLKGIDPRERIPGSRVSLGDPASLEEARAILNEAFDEHLAEQSVRAGKRARYQAFVPHGEEDRGQLRTLRRDLLSVLDFEQDLLLGFEPRFFEWNFGGRGSIVEYAGAYLTGTVDRIDVDAHGQAVVIDYKHKGYTGFAKEYAAGPFAGADQALALPRRVQSLIYGQVVRRRFPELTVVGSTYLSTRGTAHALAGAAAANVADNVFGGHAPSRQESLDAQVVPGSLGMDVLLDKVEDQIAEKVQELMAGNIEARPIDQKACAYCPVMNCEKRIG